MRFKRGSRISDGPYMQPDALENKVVIQVKDAEQSQCLRSSLLLQSTAWFSRREDEYPRRAMQVQLEACCLREPTRV